ncbi:MAG: PEP-CTERM sorting domain-containing protein [Leptolyngbya sp. SIO3F4]|nr:PEP-CTERM sorting domain-containing protein [Leptolyngbya sp. SIO3F4]
MFNRSKGYFLAALSSLGLAAAMTQPASAVTFRGIDFPLGEASFADEVVEYNKVYANGLTKEEAYAKNWNASAQAFDDPTAVLGVANSSWKGNGLPIPERDDYSLGKGGSITVKFTDNFLVGSDDDKDDLWIFEAGGLVEGMFVEISKDGENWLSLGEIGGTQHAGIDLDAFGLTSDDTFSYVKVTDNGKNAYSKGWAGVDVDAIGAISSKDVPEPASMFGLLTIGGFVASSVLKRL